ncbi:GGDEF domain-containing protein [Aurantiacibacter zhengii]|nr:GGDEF domain-containing protein [Aurantiacibacter zhengii]
MPIFMQVPRGPAATALAGCALLAIFAHSTFPTVGFGPFFLLICAFGAWFVGNLFAVLVGLFIGVIQVQSGQALALDENPVVMALQISSALAVVLMLGVARAALELEWRFARVDPLTGALNRKAFFEAVANEAHRPGIAVLLFADVDGLKRVNDDLGHDAGDEALQDFADRVRKTIRNTDIFARVGGDEFVIFLRVGDLASADKVASRLNAQVNQKGTSTLRCSIGALVMPAGSTSIDAELKEADRLMYRAKREKLGMVLAMLAKGDLNELASSAPPTDREDQQSAVIRARGRDRDITVQGRALAQAEVG